MGHSRLVLHQRHRSTALGVGDEQGPRLADAIRPLRDVVAVKPARCLVAGILLHQLALAAHGLLRVLPGVVQVREVDQYAQQTAHQTDRRGFQEVQVAFLPDGLDQIGNEHEQDDEQVVVGHLHVVGMHLEGGKDARQDKAPQVFAPVGQHDAGNHRGQIGQCPHLPDVAGGNDNQEIGTEGPHHGTQRS